MCAAKKVGTRGVVNRSVAAGAERERCAPNAYCHSFQGAKADVDRASVAE